MKKVTLLTLILFVASCSFKAAKKEPEQMAQKKSIASAKEEKKKRVAAEKRKREERELKKIVEEARPIIDNILESMNEINHGKHIRDFDDSMKSAYHDKEQFRRINEERKKKYGENVGRNIHKIERKNPFYNLHYWVKFSKVDKPIPVIITLKREEGKLKVAFLQYKFSVLKK